MANHREHHVPAHRRQKPNRVTDENAALDFDTEELSWRRLCMSFLGIVASLYIFFIGLDLLCVALQCIFGRRTGHMFDTVDNPIAGLTVGILATVLLQSSSASTSIAVSLVGVEQITVKTAIPMVMGANIGTAVTNNMISIANGTSSIDLQRAFACATVHDMFNILTVIVLLPLEVILGAITGEGGLLYWVSKAITELFIGERRGLVYDSPLSAITQPISSAFIRSNQDVVKALALPEPEAVPLSQQDIDASNCTSPTDCSQFYCIKPGMDKTFQMISPGAYEAELTPCAEYLVISDPCGTEDVCLLNAGAFYNEHVKQGQIVQGGMLESAGSSAGVLALVISIAFISAGLCFLFKFLGMILNKRARKTIAWVVDMSDFTALILACAITAVLQSSSLITTALVPICGIGLIPLEKMLALTMGANIGTTITALMVALNSLQFSTLQIALCHLLFNVFGILIWFPLPFLRTLPLNIAKLLGLYAAFYRSMPFYYMFVVFLFIPGALLALASLFSASPAVAGTVLAALILALTVFTYWWVCKGGCYRVLPLEDRKRHLSELHRSNCVRRGESVIVICDVLVPTMPPLGSGADRV